jgi:3-hydroxy-9,10-secoandrosta-1,3,5(10)-triene-9,17-dione monooxygenase reductase component
MTQRFSSKDFRDSLGLFATGIAIATTCDGAERVGITINSFASVSMDPPLVLFSVNRSLHSFAAFERAEGFAINVLRKDQRDLSARFSRPGIDKWAGVSAIVGAHGGILIQPSLATFDCRLHRHYDGGDHVIFVGEVVDLVAAARHEPLIYFRSAYHEISAPPVLLAA